MRLIGRLPHEADARRFLAYLGTQQTELQLRPAEGGWELWVLDEDRVAGAAAEWEAFRQDPAAERYRQAEAEAQRRRQAELDRALLSKRDTIVERRHRPRTSWRATPVSLAVIILCGMATAAIRFGDNKAATLQLQLTEQRSADRWSFNLPELWSGEVWRLFTPSLIHFDALHLLGNASWFYLFGRVLEQTRTRGRFITFLLLLAIGSNVAQYVAHGPNFGGLSGVDCGLFGFLWFKSQFRPEAGFHLPPEQTVFFAGWMLIALTGAVGAIANTAHLAGLGLGILLALPRSVPVFR
jgi:GlpG protein